jgi:hypothetical protein
MKPDFYTKAVLTVIALMLTVIACKPLVSPDATTRAETAPFAGVQFWSDAGATFAFDIRTGDIYRYEWVQTYGAEKKVWLRSHPRLQLYADLRR